MEGLTLSSYVPLLVFQAYYNPPSKPRPNLLAYRIATRLNLHYAVQSSAIFYSKYICRTAHNQPIGNFNLYKYTENN